MTNDISLIRIFRENFQNQPQELDPNEKSKIEQIVEKQTVGSFNSETQKEYKEYISLEIKQKGNTKMETIFKAVEKFLGDRNTILFNLFVDSVPTILDEQEFANVYRSALSEISQKELYAYFMDVTLRNFDTVYSNQISDEILNAVAKYGHDHILGPADIMMAKAGDSKREISESQIKTLFERMLKNVTNLKQ